MSKLLRSVTSATAIEPETALNGTLAYSPWLCVRTSVGRETYAQQNIEALGYET